MAVKIRVKNFQSLRDAEVDVLGLTTVTGPNNSGKTSMMRAVKGVFQNTKGTSFVRYGESKSSVSLEFGDGKKVLWEKGPSVKPTYVLNDSAPVYPGQGVPEELQALGIGPISVGGREIWPQIAQQFTGQVFLLDQPGSVLAEALADVDRVGKLNGALKAAESDRRAKNSDLKVRRADFEKWEEEAKKFEGLPDVLLNVEEIEKLHVTGQKYSKVIETLSLLGNKIKHASSVVSLLLGIEAVDLPSGTDPAEKLCSLLEYLEPLKAKLERVKGVLSRYEKAEKIPLPDSPHLAEKTQKELAFLLPLQERLVKAGNVVSKLDGVEKITPPSPTEDLGKVLQEIKDCEALASKMVLLEKEEKRLAGIEKIKTDKIEVTKTDKALATLEEGALIQKQLQQTQALETRLLRELEETEQALQELEAEILALLGTFEQCPTCGNTEMHEGH